MLRLVLLLSALVALSAAACHRDDPAGHAKLNAIWAPHAADCKLSESAGHPGTCYEGYESQKGGANTKAECCGGVWKYLDEYKCVKKGTPTTTPKVTTTPHKPNVTTTTPHHPNVTTTTPHKPNVTTTTPHKPNVTTTTPHKPNVTTTTAPKPTTTTVPAVPYKVTSELYYDNTKNPCLIFDFDDLEFTVGSGNTSKTVKVNKGNVTGSGQCGVFFPCGEKDNNTVYCASSYIKAKYAAADTNEDVIVTASFSVDAHFANETLNSLIKNDGKSHETALTSLQVDALDTTAIFNATSLGSDTWKAPLNNSYRCDVTFSYGNPSSVTPASPASIKVVNVAVESFAPTNAMGLGPEGQNIACAGKPSTSPKSSSKVGIIVGAVIAGIAGLFIIAFVWKKCRGPSESGYTKLEVN